MNATLNHNRRAWDERVTRGQWHTETARDTDFQNPLAAVDNLGWLGANVRGQRILCLAAGGGKHGILLAAAGAEVTVVDLSPEMLALDRQMAADRGLTVRLLEGSMDDLGMLPEQGFEVVIQPVSTCYVANVAKVYQEVARVALPGALYISQHKQPAALQADTRPAAQGYLLAEPYYRSGPLPGAGPGQGHREAGTLEFLHRWEELVGGLCRAGFVIEDLIEPAHGDPLAEPGSFPHRSAFMPPFVTLKARRTDNTFEARSKPKLWLPPT